MNFHPPLLAPARGVIRALRNSLFSTTDVGQWRPTQLVKD
jgi:hypothetical protein